MPNCTLNGIKSQSASRDDLPVKMIHSQEPPGSSSHLQHLLWGLLRGLWIPSQCSVVVLTDRFSPKRWRQNIPDLSAGSQCSFQSYSITFYLFHPVFWLSFLGSHLGFLLWRTWTFIKRIWHWHWTDLGAPLWKDKVLWTLKWSCEGRDTSEWASPLDQRTRFNICGKGTAPTVYGQALGLCRLIWLHHHIRGQNKQPADRLSEFKYIWADKTVRRWQMACGTLTVLGFQTAWFELIVDSLAAGARGWLDLALSWRLQGSCRDFTSHPKPHL